VLLIKFRIKPKPVAEHSEVPEAGDG